MNDDAELPRGSGPGGYLTKQELANALRVALVTIDKKVALGQINSTKVFRKRYFPPSEPKRLIDAGFQPAVRQSKAKRQR